MCQNKGGWKGNNTPNPNSIQGKRIKFLLEYCKEESSKTLQCNREAALTFSGKLVRSNPLFSFSFPSDSGLVSWSPIASDSVGLWEPTHRKAVAKERGLENGSCTMKDHHQWTGRALGSWSCSAPDLGPWQAFSSRLACCRSGQIILTPLYPCTLLPLPGPVWRSYISLLNLLCV